MLQKTPDSNQLDLPMASFGWQIAGSHLDPPAVPAPLRGGIALTFATCWY